jgi:hypothetical protein
MQEFRLAKLCFKHRATKTMINSYFSEGCGNIPSGFRSADAMWKKIKQMDTDLEMEWVVDEVDWKIPDIKPTTFYRRNVVNCVKYLVKQKAFASQMQFRPSRQFNADGERVYSEMWTCDWWWEEQVCILYATRKKLTAY